MKSYEERDLHAQVWPAINADSTSASTAAHTKSFIPKQKEQLIWWAMRSINNQLVKIIIIAKHSWIQTTSLRVYLKNLSMENGFNVDQSSSNVKLSVDKRRSDSYCRLKSSWRNLWSWLFSCFLSWRAEISWATNASSMTRNQLSPPFSKLAICWKKLRIRAGTFCIDWK